MSPPAVVDDSQQTMAPDHHQDLILDPESNKENHQPPSQSLIANHPKPDQDYTFRNSFPSKAAALHSMDADGEWEYRRTDLLSVGQAFQYHFRCKRNNPFRICWAQFYILQPHWQEDVFFVFAFNTPHTCDWTPEEKPVGKRVRIPKEVKAEIKRLVHENWSPIRIWTEYGQKVLENKRQLVYCLKLALAPQTEDETEDSIVISDGEDNGMDIDLEESIQKTMLKKELAISN